MSELNHVKQQSIPPRRIRSLVDRVPWDSAIASLGPQHGKHDFFCRPSDSMGYEVLLVPGVIDERPIGLWAGNTARS